MPDPIAQNRRQRLAKSILALGLPWSEAQSRLAQEAKCTERHAGRLLAASKREKPVDAAGKLKSLPDDDRKSIPEPVAPRPMKLPRSAKALAKWLHERYQTPMAVAGRILQAEQMVACSTGIARIQAARFFQELLAAMCPPDESKEEKLGVDVVVVDPETQKAKIVRES